MIRIAVLSLFVGLAACQVTSTEFSREGFYAGASVVGATSNFDLDDWDDDSTVGIGVRAGYRFWDRIGFELAYEGGQKYDGDDFDVDIRNLAVQGKFYPLTGALQPYGLLGVGILWGDVGGKYDDGSAGFGRIGVGLEAYVLPSLPLFIELDYNKPGGDVSELDYYSGQIGAIFRF
jgi:opacity protein-like surface antigen